MEKETLEEAAYQARRDYQDEVGKDGMNECIMLDAMKIQKGFELGAKWQAERMYSEEDLREAFKQSRQCLIFEKDMPPVYNEFEDWFEQFKKK